VVPFRHEVLKKFHSLQQKGRSVFLVSAISMQAQDVTAAWGFEKVQSCTLMQRQSTFSAVDTCFALAWRAFQSELFQKPIPVFWLEC